MSATATDLDQPPRWIRRGVGAILAGALVGIVLERSADAVLRAAGIYPPLG